MSVSNNGILTQATLNDIRVKIIDELKASTGEIITSAWDGNKIVKNTETGNVMEKCDNKDIIKIISYKESNDFSQTVSFSPSEAMIQIIVDKVFNAIVKQVEVSLKARMDKLEDDFNAMLITMTSVGTGMSTAPLTPVGAAFTAISTAAGNTVATPRVALTTIPLKAQEITQLK